MNMTAAFLALGSCHAMLGVAHAIKGNNGWVVWSTAWLGVCVFGAVIW